MKTTHILAATLLLSAAGQVQAQTVVEDLDASGGLSLEELQAAYADLTEEQFVLLDTDESGEVSLEELAAQAGIGAEEFKNCLKREEIRTAIIKNHQDAREQRLPGTPTLLIDGEIFERERTAEATIEKLKAEIAKRQ